MEIISWSRPASCQPPHLITSPSETAPECSKPVGPRFSFVGLRPLRLRTWTALDLNHCNNVETGWIEMPGDLGDTEQFMAKISGDQHGQISWNIWKLSHAFLTDPCWKQYSRLKKCCLASTCPALEQYSRFPVLSHHLLCSAIVPLHWNPQWTNSWTSEVEAQDLAICVEGPAVQ